MACLRQEASLLKCTFVKVSSFLRSFWSTDQPANPGSIDTRGPVLISSEAPSVIHWKLEVPMLSRQGTGTVGSLQTSAKNTLLGQGGKLHQSTEPNTIKHICALCHIMCTYGETNGDFPGVCTAGVQGIEHPGSIYHEDVRNGVWKMCFICPQSLEASGNPQAAGGTCTWSLLNELRINMINR